MKGVVKTVWPSDFAGKVINVLCTPVNGSAGDFHTHGLNAHIVCKENQFTTLYNKDFWKKTQHTQACHIRTANPNNSLLICPINSNKSLLTCSVNKNSLLTCPVNWTTTTVLLLGLWMTRTAVLPSLWTTRTALFLPVLWIEPHQQSSYFTCDPQQPSYLSCEPQQQPSYLSCDRTAFLPMLWASSKTTTDFLERSLDTCSATLGSSR